MGLGRVALLEQVWDAWTWGSLQLGTAALVFRASTPAEQGGRAATSSQPHQYFFPYVSGSPTAERAKTKEQEESKPQPLLDMHTQKP